MSKNIDQVFIANPITVNASTDLMYFGQSPYGAGNDAAMTYANFSAQFGAPYTPAALTSANDTNVTITLGGSPTTALLHAASLTLGWTGQLSGARGGTGVNNGSNTATFAGNLNFANSFTTSGNFAVTQTYTGITNVTFPTSGTLATTSQIPTGAALTKTDDTNVTLTLGGSPTTALVNAASITAGWTGQLSLIRGGSNASLTASNGGIVYSTASAMAILSGTATANLPLLSGSSSAPAWGAFALSLGGALTTAGALTTSGAFGATFTFTNTTSVTFPTSGTLATTASIPSFPLSLANGGTNANLTASNGGIFYSTATAGAILSGTATANQVLLSGTSSAPSWSTATYPATTTINQILYSSSANVITGLATGNNGVLITSAGGAPSISSTLPTAVQTNITQLGTVTVGTWNASVIGGTYGGTGVNNGASTITIGGSVTFSGAFTFTGTLTATTAVTFPTSGTLATTAQTMTIVNQNTSSATLVNNNKYIVNNGASLVTFTLPASAALGDTYIIVGGSSGGWKINVASGQTLHLGSSTTTTSTGSLASTNQYDCIYVTNVTANTTFTAYNIIGNITVV